MLWTHCSYFSALINQFLLDQVLEHFPLQYLCCWMNNQLSELGKKCISATDATPPQCISVSLNESSETHSPSRHFSMIFRFFESNSGKIGWAPSPVNGTARRSLDWISPQMSARLLPLCIIPSLHRLTIQGFDAFHPGHGLSDGKHSPSCPDRLNLRLYIYGNVWMSNLCSISSSAFHLSIYFSIQNW